MQGAEVCGRNEHAKTIGLLDYWVPDTIGKGTREMVMGKVDMKGSFVEHNRHPGNDIKQASRCFGQVIAFWCPILGHQRHTSSCWSKAARIGCH